MSDFKLSRALEDILLHTLRRAPQNMYCAAQDDPGVASLAGMGLMRRTGKGPPGASDEYSTLTRDGRAMAVLVEEVRAARERERKAPVADGPGETGGKESNGE